MDAWALLELNNTRPEDDSVFRRSTVVPCGIYFAGILSEPKKVIHKAPTVGTTSLKVRGLSGFYFL